MLRRTRSVRSLREDLDHTNEEPQKLQVDKSKKSEPLERRRSSALEMKLTRSNSLSVVYNKNNMNKSSVSLLSIPARSLRILGGGTQIANTTMKRCNPVAPKMDSSCDDRDSDNDWVLSGDELGISENEEALDHDDSGSSGSSCSSDDEDQDQEKRQEKKIPSADNDDECHQHRRRSHNATRSATTKVPATNCISRPQHHLSTDAFQRQTSFSKRSSTSSKHSGSDARRSATAAAKVTASTTNISNSRLVVDINNLNESSISLLEEVSQFFGENGKSTTKLIMSPSPRTERRKQQVQRQRQNDRSLSPLFSPVSADQAPMASAAASALPRLPQLQRASTAPTAMVASPSASANPTHSKKKNSNEDGFLSPVVFAPSSFPTNHRYHDPHGHTLLYRAESNQSDDLLDDEGTESEAKDFMPGTSVRVESAFSQSDSNLLRDAEPQTRQRHSGRQTKSTSSGTHHLQGSWCSLPTPTGRRANQHFDPNHSLLISPTFLMKASSSPSPASNNIDPPLDRARPLTAPFRDNSTMDGSGKLKSRKTRRDTTTTAKPPKEGVQESSEDSFAPPRALSAKDHGHKSPSRRSAKATSPPRGKSGEQNVQLPASLLSPRPMPPLGPILETQQSSASSIDLASPLKQLQSRSKSPTRYSTSNQSKSPKQQHQSTNKGGASHEAVLEFASTVGGSSKRQITERSHYNEEISVVSASVGEKNDPLFQLLKTLLEKDPSNASNGLSNFFVDGMTDDASRNSRHTKYTITTKITISAAPQADEGDQVPPRVEWPTPSGTDKKKRPHKKSSKSSSRTTQREKSSTANSIRTTRQQSEIFQSSFTAMDVEPEVALPSNMGSPSRIISSNIEDMFQHDCEWPTEWLEPKPSSNSESLKSHQQHHHREGHTPESPGEIQGDLEDDASPRSTMAFAACFDDVKPRSYQVQEINQDKLPKLDSRFNGSAPPSFFVGARDYEQKQANSTVQSVAARRRNSVVIASQPSKPDEYPPIHGGNQCSPFRLQQDVDSIRYGYETAYWHDHHPNAASDEESFDSPRYGLLKNSQMASDALTSKMGRFSGRRRFSLESGNGSREFPGKQTQPEGKSQRRFSLDSTSHATPPVADAMGSKDRRSRKERKDKTKKRIRVRRLSLDSRLKDKANPAGATASGEDRYSKTKEKPRRMSLPSTLPSYPGSGMAHAAKEVMKFVLRPAKQIVKSSRSRLARSKSPGKQRHKRPPLDTDGD